MAFFLFFFFTFSLPLLSLAEASTGVGAGFTGADVVVFSSNDGAPDSWR